MGAGLHTRSWLGVRIPVHLVNKLLELKSSTLPEFYVHFMLLLLVPFLHFPSLPWPSHRLRLARSQLQPTRGFQDTG